MKKILFCMATLGMAVSIQAAAVAWNTGTLYAPDTTTGAYGTQVAQNQAYTATITFFTSPDGGLTYTPFAVSTGTTANNTNKSGALGATTSSDFAASTTYYASIVITDPTGLWQLTQEYMSFNVPSSGPGSAPFNFGATGSWVQVPEPATMALLGIGVVAVGLRRRRK